MSELMTIIANDNDSEYYLIETEDVDLIKRLLEVAYYTYAIERNEAGEPKKLRATIKKSQLQLTKLEAIT